MNMKPLKLRLLAALLVCGATLLSSCAGQTSVLPEKPADAAVKTSFTPFLDAEALPDGALFLPPPPSPTDGAFHNDFHYYQWGKAQRDTPAGELAASDEDAKRAAAFSEAFGMTLSESATPEILRLAERAVADAHLAYKPVKKKFGRRRPHVVFNEASLLPDRDAEEAKNFSYPSGHTTRGWVFAMALAGVAPERTEALMERAYRYALGRVICGRHWKSDIDAGLMLAAGVFSALVGDEDYQRQLAKAREEYRRLKGDRK